MQFKVRFKLLIPGLVVGLLSIGIIIKTIAYANENKFCDKWQIIGLGSVYVTSDTLNITENEITWPGCKPTSYKVISMEDNSAKFLVPHLESNSIQEDSGEGYLMVITSRGDDYIDIGVYDAKTGENTEQELTWGSFRRIPFDKERNYFGSIGEFPITMHLVVAKSGQVDGFYKYDKYDSEIPVIGEIEDEHITLKAFAENGDELEVFTGDNRGGNIEGEWVKKNTSLEYTLNREPWEDHYISCEELQNYPERVFAQGSVDLGSGVGSPNAIDYNCEGGLLSMEFLGNIYAISNQVRSESLTIKCSGSISYLHRRSFHYNLLKAGLAPEIFASNWRTSYSIQDMVDYFKSWAHYSLYNFDLYNSFWEEYREVKPILASHYMANFNLSEEKALEYADNALNIYLNWAVGSFSFDDRPGTLQIIEVLSNTNVSVKSLENDLGTHLLSSNNLDKALKVALLYQKQKSILEFLLQKGARIDKGDESALFFALRNREHVEYLLGKGANVNYENGFGKTVLFYAIQNNDIELVQLLLEKNADVNHHYKSEDDIKDLGLSFNYCGLEHFKRTPLMHAAQNGTVAIMKLLLQYGADIEAQDQVGYNAMDYAVLGEKAENVNYLSSLGLKGNK